MELTKVKWVSKAGQEAVLTVTDGNIQLICFCHPCESPVELAIPLYIFAINADRITLENKEQKQRALRLGSEDIPGYEIVGTVLDSSTISLSRFMLELDKPIPGDISVGDRVRFTCDRLHL